MKSAQKFPKQLASTHSGPSFQKKKWGPYEWVMPRLALERKWVTGDRLSKPRLWIGHPVVRDGQFHYRQPT